MAKNIGEEICRTGKKGGEGINVEGMEELEGMDGGYGDACVVGDVLTGCMYRYSGSTR